MPTGGFIYFEGFFHRYVEDERNKCVVWSSGFYVNVFFFFFLFGMDMHLGKMDGSICSGENMRVVENARARVNAYTSSLSSGGLRPKPYCYFPRFAIVQHIPDPGSSSRYRGYSKFPFFSPKNFISINVSFFVFHIQTEFSTDSKLFDCSWISAESDVDPFFRRI